MRARGGVAPRWGLGAVALLCSVAGCGAGRAISTTDAPVTSGDASATCEVGITPPIDPRVGVQPLRFAANVSAGGVLAYHWQVTRGGALVPFTSAQADGSQIDVVAATPGVYHLQLDVDASASCPSGVLDVNVLAAGAQPGLVRMRAFPPAGEPPQERTIQVSGGGGAFVAPDWTLDPGLALTGRVSSATAGVAAYLRFMPADKPDEAVETFSDTTGAFSARFLDGAHDVLVVPMVAGVAPALIHGWSVSSIPSGALVAPAGVAVHGAVHGPGGAAVAGAKVRLTLATAPTPVPSTYTTTAADGSFTVKITPEALAAGAPLTVDVVPPSASGLPRLTAAGTTLDLNQPVQVTYAAGLATRDVGGVAVGRAGAPLAATSVTLVGQLAAVGQVTAGGTVAASGAVQLALLTDGAGHLPSALAPAAALVAVVAPGPGDVALAALDLTAAAPAAIDAPAMTAASGKIVDASGAPLDGVALTASGLGSLAAASVADQVVTTAIDGSFTLHVPAGGHLALRALDPAARGAALELADVTVVPTTLTLPAAIRVTTTVRGASGVRPGVAVQVVCGGCVGIARTRALAEGVANGFGAVSLAVPDPGVQ